MTDDSWQDAPPPSPDDGGSGPGPASEEAAPPPQSQGPGHGSQQGTQPSPSHSWSSQTSDQTQEIVVPDWLLEDWGVGLRLAATSLMVWILAALALVLVVVMVSGLRVGLSDVQWGELLGSLLAMPLVYLGGVKGAPVLLTGLALSYVTFRLAARWVGPLPRRPDPARLAALAVKAAMLLSAAMLIVAIIWDVVDLGAGAQPRIGLFSGTAPEAGFNYVAIVFLLLPISAVTALWALLRATDTSPLWLAGVPDVSVPSILRTSWAGVRRGLLILIGVLVIWGLGFTLEFATQDFGEFSDFAAAVLSILFLGAVAAAVDIAALGFVGAMSFLSDGGFVFGNELGEGTPEWAWIAVVIVAAAFVAAGYRAAQERRPETMAQAVTSAALVGPIFAGLGVVVAIVWAAEFPESSLAAQAILLPLLWGLLALGGAAFYAMRRDLPTGVVAVSRSQAQQHRSQRPAGPQPTPASQDASTSQPSGPPPDPTTRAPQQSGGGGAPAPEDAQDGDDGGSSPPPSGPRRA